MKKWFKILSVSVISIMLLLISCIPASEQKGIDDFPTQNATRNIRQGNNVASGIDSITCGNGDFDNLRTILPTYNIPALKEALDSVFLGDFQTMYAQGKAQGRQTSDNLKELSDIKEQFVQNRESSIQALNQFLTVDPVAWIAEIDAGTADAFIFGNESQGPIGQDATWSRSYLLSQYSLARVNMIIACYENVIATQNVTSNQSGQATSSNSTSSDPEIDALLNKLSAPEESSQTQAVPQQTESTNTAIQAVQASPTFSISTSTNSYKPFEHIEIDVAGLDSSSDYWVEIKPNATGGWDNSSIISYPAITTRTNKISANAIPASVLSNSNSYELRIRQGSNTYSNPVRIQEVLPQIPASQAGRATATLDIVQNLMREASSDNSYLPQMSLSSVYQSSQDLGIDPLALDQLSESILTEITDGAISTITDDRSSLNAMQEIDDLIEECFDDLENSTPIEEGYEYVLSCYAEVSEEVLEDEQLIDEMSELYDENIGLGRASTSMLEYIAEQDLADGDLENLLAASLISEAGTQSLEIAEDLPEDFDSDDPEYLAERENEEDTFDDISENIEEFQDYVEQDIDYDDFAESFGDLNELDALRNLEGNSIDQLERTVADGSSQVDISLTETVTQTGLHPNYIPTFDYIGEFIGVHPDFITGDSSSRKDKNGDNYITNKCIADLDFYAFPFYQTPYSFTTINNIRHGNYQFVSCRKIVPLLEQNDSFLKYAFLPLTFEYNSASNGYRNCLSRYSSDQNPPSDICETEFLIAANISNEIINLLENFSPTRDYSNYERKIVKSLPVINQESENSNDSEQLTCEANYTQFQSSVANIQTCVHSSLVLEDTNVQAGSYIPSERGLDVGSSNVRITYSRDFIKGGECIQGYEKVFFLEKNRCRWTGLTLDEVVAYTINTSTQKQEVVIR